MLKSDGSQLREAHKASTHSAQFFAIPASLRKNVYPSAIRWCRFPADSSSILNDRSAVDTTLAKGDAREALRLARTVVRRSRHAAEAWLFLGVVRQKLRHERRAEIALRRALTLDEDLAEAHNRLGILLVGRGEVEKGHAHLLRAVALAPEDPSPQLHLAQACVLLGRRADAETHLRAAQDLGARPELVDAVRRAFFAA